MKFVAVGRVKHIVTNDFDTLLNDQSSFVDMSNANWEKLTEAVNDEYVCGRKGSIIDIVKYLNDTFGISEFDIYVE